MSSGLGIPRVLVEKSAVRDDGGTVRVVQVTADAATDIRLQVDVLLRALQKTPHPGVKPIVPRA